MGFCNSLLASYHLHNFPLSQYFHGNNNVCCSRTTALTIERCFFHVYSQARNKFSLYIVVSREYLKSNMKRVTGMLKNVKNCGDVKF